MSSLLLQLGALIVLAFLTAIFFAAQERWGAIKCLILGGAFPVTIPVALYFMGRKWWVDRKRIKQYAQQIETTRELNDVYVPKDHVEHANPNFVAVDPFSYSHNSVDEEAELLSSAPEMMLDGRLSGESVSVMDPSGGVSHEEDGSVFEEICSFHQKHPNFPYSGCTCNK
jgi:hypothetical protein